MERQNTTLDSFDVIGIKTRTTNQEELNGVGRISGLWNQFHIEGVAKKIVEKGPIMAIYHDYESDFNGAYNLMIGVKVKKGTAIPEGFERLSLPKQNYIKFTTKEGQMPNIVLEAWQQIWSDKEISRKYSYDIEVYDERSLNPKSAQVDIYIAY